MFRMRLTETGVLPASFEDPDNNRQYDVYLITETSTSNFLTIRLTEANQTEYFLSKNLVQGFWKIS